jgi:hypothetical protein
MSGSNVPVQRRSDLTVPITAALLFGLATLVVPSIRGGSIAVSMTGLTVSVNAPSRCGAASNQRQVAFWSVLAPAQICLFCDV